MAMRQKKKTLLLVFIHGFKGGEDTFGEKSEFSRRLAASVGAALPRVAVRAITYPQYETRGDLRACVGRFRDWLLEQVIDAEVANGSPAPTVDPSVRAILVGHSMGGIVAAETAIAIASEKPIVHAPASSAAGYYDEEDDDYFDYGAGFVGGDTGYSGESNSRSRSGSGAGGGGSGSGSGSGKTKATTPNSYYTEAAFNGIMFPYIQGVLAFDTPYLGIAPGVVAHGAEGHYNKAAAALTQLSGLSGMFFGNSEQSQPQPQSQQQRQRSGSRKGPAGRLPAPPPPPEKKKESDSGGGWASWGKMALYAGAAAGAVAAGGAAYANRQHLTEGWSWVGSHLEFVGCLARAEELRARTMAMARLGRELDVGFANLYTRLGRGAASKQVSMVGTVIGSQRTFCNLPSSGSTKKAPPPEQLKKLYGVWKEAVNDKADDETGAHMNMFEPKENPAYAQLAEDAKNLVVEWSRNEWYESNSRGMLERDDDVLFNHARGRDINPTQAYGW